MNILDRYVASAFLKNYLVAIVGLTALYLLQGILGEIIEGDFPASQIFYYHMMSIPDIMVQMTPPGVMMAVVFTLSGLNRSNELVAIFSVGVGLPRIIFVLLSFVFMISCFSLIFQDRILPHMYKQRTSYYWREMKKKEDFFFDVKQDKIWYRSGNLIFNLRTFDFNSKTIHGISVYMFNDKFDLLRIITAEKALFSQSGWRLLNGKVIKFLEKDLFPLITSFKERELEIKEKPNDFREIEKEVDGLRLKELVRYTKRVRDAGADTKSYEVKFHSRVSLSFIPLVMALLGIPFSIRRSREGGVAKDLVICLGVTFFYWLFYSVGLSLGKNGALPPWLSAWLSSAVFGAIALVLLYKQRVF